jgi:iron(III) transport system permease protein
MDADRPERTPHVGHAMNGWRIAYGVGLIAFVVFPLSLPFAGLTMREAWIWTTDDLVRLRFLSLNTLTLTAATIALSLPAGVGVALLVYRTSFFGRRALLFFLALALLVPLPVLVTSWQAFLGADGLGFWRGSARLWATGMGPAIWIHAIAAVPWVAFIVGVGLTWVEPEREDEAAQSVGPWRVLALVTLPRARASILAAALFVLLQTASETNVTDIMLVPTLADEVRTQFAQDDRPALARTLVLALPGLLLTWIAVLGLLAYLEKHLPPLAPVFRSQRPLDLGPAWLRWIVGIVLLTLILAPVGSLVWKLGISGHPPEWKLDVAWRYLHAETIVKGKDLAESLATAIITGLTITGLALVGCWLARERAWFRWLLFSVLTWAWVLPGPAVGIGLLEAIMGLPDGPWKVILYYRPSPAPIMWAQTIRVLPIAVVFLWPVMRMIPRELFDEARLGGTAAFGEFLHIVVPMARRAALVTAIAAIALCLGEVSASARVQTPGWESYTKLLLDAMHYSVNNSLAALNLLMMASLVALALVASGAWSICRLRLSARAAPGER